MKTYKKGQTNGIATMEQMPIGTTHVLGQGLQKPRVRGL